MAAAQPARTAEQTIARNTTILVWALVWIPLMAGVVAFWAWGLNTIQTYNQAQVADEAYKTAQVQAYTAAQQQAQAQAARIAPLRQALADTGFDPTAPHMGYGSVEGFAQQECSELRMMQANGRPLSLVADNLAGVTPMPPASASEIINAITSTGLCNS
jgi:hypothetical protein